MQKRTRGKSRGRNIFTRVFRIGMIRQVGKVVGVLGLGLLAISAGVVWRQERNQKYIGFEPFRYVYVARDGEKILSVGIIQISTGMSKKAVVLKIPNDLMISVSRGYGNYRVGSVMGLGRIEQLEDKLLTESLEQEMALHIQGLVEVDKNFIDKVSRGELLKIHRKQLVMSLLNSNSVWDWWKVWRVVKTIDDQDIKMIDLTKTAAVTVNYDVDGSELLKLSKVGFDDLVSREMVDEMVTVSGVEVVVENTTDQSGLATTYSRLIRNEGFDVVGVVDSNKTLVRSMILVSSERLVNEDWLRILKNLFKDVEVRVGMTEDYRCDVVVRLGKDMTD